MGYKYYRRDYVSKNIFFCFIMFRELSIKTESVGTNTDFKLWNDFFRSSISIHTENKNIWTIRNFSD